MNEDIFKNLGTIAKPLDSPYSKNTLSICMIVRNEEANIKAAIESFKPVADEIIINDTGSTDNTIKLIHSLSEGTKIRWFSSEWKNDFSLARNQALEKATSAWVMYLDADDRIPFTEYEGINKLKTASLDRVFSFQILNTQKNLSIAYSPICLQTRMFPNHKEIRFTRRVHEQVIYSIAKLGLHDRPLHGKIIHTGYEKDEQKKAKAIRNIDIAMTETKLMEEDATFIMAIGDSYYILEQWSDGIDMYLKALRLSLNKERKSVLACDVGKGYARMNATSLAIKYFNYAYGLDESNVEALFYKAETLNKLGKVFQSEKYYRKITTIHTYKPAFVVKQFNVTQICSYNALGISLMKRHEYVEAIKLYKEMLTRYVNVSEGWENLSMCYKQIGKDKLAEDAESESKRLTGE